MGIDPRTEKGHLLHEINRWRRWFVVVVAVCAAAAAALFAASRSLWQPESLAWTIMLFSGALALCLLGLSLHFTKISRLVGQLSDSNARLNREMAEREHLEDTLRASEQRYRLLAENMYDVVWTMDLSGRFTYFTPSVKRVLGYDWSPGDELRFEQVLAPESLAMSRDIIGKAIAKENAGERVSPMSLDLEHMRPDGSRFWAEVTCNPLYDENGKFAGIQGITRDISEFRLAREAMERESAKLKGMISGMEEGVVFADADDVVVEINDYLCRFFGVVREKLIGKRLVDIHKPEILGKIAPRIEQFREKIGASPFVLQRSFGATEVIMRVQPIYRDDKYDGVLLNVIDVSELVKARRQAEAANREKSRFLANMSHEIRTPMTAILGYTDLLMDQTLDATSRNSYLATIRRSGSHLLTLINDILDLSKIEAGKVSLEMGRCNVVSLLAEVASMLRPRAKQRNIAFSIRYATEIPETILTDGERLRQAILNLAGNAIKFTEKGEVGIVASFLTDWCADQPAVRFEVIDTGIGIHEEFLPRLFQPFSQDDMLSAKKSGGTGLGLAISHHIAHILGGDLTAKSEFGQGSTFTLTVPAGDMKGVAMLQHPSESEQESAKAAWTPPSNCLNGARILLAEDGYDNRELIRTVLYAAGADVKCVENGLEAVTEAQKEQFDAILMDMNMPEMDGYEATRLLRDRGYDRPILALTANAMTGDSQRCLAAGCNEHLAKPIDREQLVGAIAKHIGRADKMEMPLAEVPGTVGEVEDSEDFAIVSRYINDPDISTILEGFVSRLGGQLDAMREAFVAGRHDDLRRLAHQLKGAGGCYGYPTLTERSKALEEAAKICDEALEISALDKVALHIKAVQRGYEAKVSAEKTTS